MILSKRPDIERFLKEPTPGVRAAVIYGRDRGVVRDRADASPKGKSGKARSSAKKPKKPSPAKTVSVTVSIGASVRDERRTSLDEVLKAADEALYKAKNGGRNQVAWK